MKQKDNSIIPTQEKPNQLALITRSTETTPETEEDPIIKEAVEEHVIETLNAEAKQSNGELTLEACEATPLNPLKCPRTMVEEEDKPEKSLEELVPTWCHEYIDIFTEKEAIDLPSHRPWDHEVHLVLDAPPSIHCKVYPLSKAENEFQAKYIKEQLDASLI